ncbi:MAG: hypothetical protein EH225_00685 [Calditrichaeota bacterium]|nr:hypothetical protein [Calditrichota bacterium]RQW08143.1 MAG: hypothetical protein EH225_00685 [Calditrichota bacterium]
MNDGYRSNLIKNIEENLNDFQSILSSLPDHNPNPENSRLKIREIIRTVTVVEEDILEMRLKKIIELENPYLPAIQVERLKEQAIQNQRSLEQLIEKFLYQKKEIIRFLYNIPVFSWDRTGFHELEGHVTFEEFIRRMIRNDKQNISLLRESLESDEGLN